jgi:uncharacterized protein with HEPN domain
LTRDEIYLRDVLTAIASIEDYVALGRQAFLDEPMRQDAVLRRLEIIGEATKLLSEDARLSAPEIPWRRVAGLRDRLIHAYGSVDLEIVWEVVVRDLPALQQAVRRLLAAE